jgi:hypothetical protein
LRGVPQEYSEIRGGFGQVTGFLAVWKGVKPVLDDWIPTARLDDFRVFAKALGLHTFVDSAFHFIADESAARTVVGGDKLNTTRALGLPPWNPGTNSYAHVFVARDPTWLRVAEARGWYALVVDDRVIEKPWIDHYEFGKALGYPECCRRFFAFHNEWHTNNSLYQAARSTRAPRRECNTLMKHSGFSYGWHLPCSFDCGETIELASRVRAAVAEEGPELAEFVDDLLGRPFLFLSEWESFGFGNATRVGGCLAYGLVFMAPSNRPDLRLWRMLRDGDCIEIAGDVVRVSAGGIPSSVYRAMADRFGPQVPVLMDFSRREA